MTKLVSFRFNPHELKHISNISTIKRMDLLAEIGIKSPIQYEDYLEGLKNIE